MIYVNSQPTRRLTVTHDDYIVFHWVVIKVFPSGNSADKTESIEFILQRRPGQGGLKTVAQRGFIVVFQTFMKVN